MTMKLDPANPTSFDNARFLLAACEFAYLREATGKPAFAETLGLNATLYSVSNTQVYVGENDEAIVVAFRGSEAPNALDGFKDWLLTNANNFLIVPEGQLGTDFLAAGVGARFHRGFMQALADIWDPFYAAVDAAMKAKERPIWVTGHSLGGALALLAAWRLQQNYMSIHQVVTFGAPMVGNDAAAAAFRKEFGEKIARFVDALDIVPLLPTVSLTANMYLHCDHEHRLDGGSEAPAQDAVTSLSVKAVDGVLSITLIDEFWGLLTSRVEHHMIPSYKSRIDASSQSATT